MLVRIFKETLILHESKHFSKKMYIFVFFAISTILQNEPYGNTRNKQELRIMEDVNLQQLSVPNRKNTLKNKFATQVKR